MAYNEQLCNQIHKDLAIDIIDIKNTTHSHEKRLSNLEKSDATLTAKLDITNKLLFSMLCILATALVAFLFEVIKKGGIFK